MRRLRDSDAATALGGCLLVCFGIPLFWLAMTWIADNAPWLVFAAVGAAAVNLVGGIMGYWRPLGLNSNAAEARFHEARARRGLPPVPRSEWYEPPL